MCKNAKIFNSAGSKMFQDADVLLDHFILKMQQLMDCRKLNSREYESWHRLLFY